MDELSLNKNITIKEMMSALNQLQSQVENDFRNYTKCLYSSKVKAHFPHMLTPTFKGCYIKISDCYFEDDSNYIDLEQQVRINLSKQQQILYSPISTRILPFDVTNIESQNNGIELTFAAKAKPFRLQDNNFSFWLYSDHIPIEQLIHIFEKLTKTKSVHLTINLDDGSIYSRKVDVSYGYDYMQHSNHRFRQNLSDPRLQFRVNVNLFQHFSQKINNIKILIDDFCIEDLYQEKLKDLFHTNIIPVVNQYQTISASFIMDGDYEIYWLETKEKFDSDFFIHEVLTVYADKQPIAPIDYKVIYKDGKVGLEFNQISQVFNKTIFADIYISYQIDQALMDNYHKTSVKWLNQNISTYRLDVKSLITNSTDVYDSYLIEPLLKILRTPYIHNWKLEDWQGLLKFTDISALVKIQPWLNDIFIDQHMQISLYFKSVPENYHEWVRFYLRQLEIFLQKNTKHIFKIKGCFQ
ncbi:MULTISPECIES: type VI secretion system baseplate subunit TssF/IglH [unclassified Francisella]|uniref:type VI secretion system baseplate subunit TssF/IglH n=1 Tax=unclassified Francisella TaxID=2610885 RepID=UPI002E36EEE5|nr:MULTISPECIES: type VI secretion system baseplate subunit TssF/IglH [unclassified Francisella]MED7818887.1 type VI secretion system baseplate subunit TssF/IglH [Francisella sp. 19S2-4]MED7829724.1 type VI secretion system baseplate subunit TssF/IglH [Francisella sp. 19S2-10]